MASQSQPSVANRLDELEKKVADCIKMQWQGMSHFSNTFNQITSLRNTGLALEEKLRVLEQKLLGLGQRKGIDGGNNTYTVGGAKETYDMQKDPNVPEAQHMN
jgi:hypothetical protein